MRYTFTKDDGNQQTVEIPDAWLKDRKATLGISHTEACHLWLYDHDLMKCPEAEALTAKAKANGMDTAGTIHSAHKAPTRKPDMDKRGLIQELATSLADVKTANVEDIQITNIERIIAFRIGNDNYELTLSKKRKPKDK